MDNGEDVCEGWNLGEALMGSGKMNVEHRTSNVQHRMEDGGIFYGWFFVQRKTNTIINHDDKGEKNMGTNVFANGMGISHKGSGAMSIVGPDVCKTPAGPSVVPIPYTNMAQSADLVQGSKTVKINGQSVAIKGCSYGISTGDEPGSAGGVVSGKTKGKAEFVSYSFDVKIEGKNVCRNGDLMTHNDKNTMG